MSTARIVVTIFAGLWVGYSAASLLRRDKQIVQFLTDYGVPPSWFPWLGTAKAAGAAGLLVGLFVPVIGVMAGIGLVLYFTGAVVTVIRARWYSHIPFPLMYMAPVACALVLRFTS
jgi:DoxX-like protein